MKTAEQVKAHIESVMAQIGQATDSGSKKKLVKRLHFLMKCQAYLQTEPRPEYLKSEADRIMKKAAQVRKNFVEDYPKVHDSKFRNEYEEEHGLKRDDLFLTMIEYLLETN